MNSVHKTTFHLFSVTKKGDDLSKQISELLKKNFESDIVLRSTSDMVKSTGLKMLVADAFKTHHVLIFICSTGIAVRMIAPHVVDKLKDPACLVLDDHARFSISLLSGHVGKANYYAEFLAKLLHPDHCTVPVITTASDIRGLEGFESVMSYYKIALEANRSIIKQMNASIVAGEIIGLFIDPLLLEVTSIPVRFKGEALAYYSDLHLLANHKGPKVVISLRNIHHWISEASDLTFYEVETAPLSTNSPSKRVGEDNILVLYSKSLVLGTGCRKALDNSLYIQELKKVLTETQYDIRSISKVSSISLKANESCINNLSESCQIPFIIHEPEFLLSYCDVFEGSDFVKNTTGIPAVAGPSAYAISGDELTLKIYKMEKCTFSFGRIPL